MTSILELPPRRARIVERLSLDGRAAQRLRELGIITGASLTVIRFAPLGDPVLIFVSGSRIAIRASTAAQIHVLSTRPV